MTPPRETESAVAPPSRAASEEAKDTYGPPEKPAAPEQDVLHHIAPGEKEDPETILKRQLGRRGLKYTNERRAILKAVLSTHEHFDADWLYNHLRKHDAKASKATVYRTLKVLCECGLLREVFQGEHGAYFEHIYGHEHHEHMICLTCGKVIEFISRRLEQLQDEACRAHGFHAVRHHLQVFGYCSDCHPCKATFPPNFPANPKA
jgi:Fur family ferric uptake transcriptional regulator